MKSFRDPNTNVLVAWGYSESNGDCTAREESADFNLEPGNWKLVDDVWQPYVDTNALIRAQIQQIEDQSGASSIVREALIGTAQFIAQQTAAQMTAAGQPTTADELLALNKGYQEAILIETQVKTLEAQLT